MDYALLVVGLGLSCFGFLIYYLLPLSLMSFNLGLFFNIFFGILLGMLFGLILLSLNFEHLVERVVVWLCLSWELRCVPSIVLKNLVAHRVRNRKTTIMYALTVGFIIFITVAYTTEVKSFESTLLKDAGGLMGASFHYWAYPLEGKDVGLFESFLKGHPAVIDWGWRSAYLGWSDESYDDTYVSNVGHVFQHSAILVAVSPNYLEIAFQEYIVPSIVDADSDLSLTEQLYTVGGSQGMLMSSMLEDWLGIHDLHTPFLFLGQKRPREGFSGLFDIHRVRPLAFLDSSPGVLRFTPFALDTAQHAVVSFQQLIRLSRGQFNSFADVPLSRIVIKVREDSTKAELDDLKAHLKAVAGNALWEVFDYRDFGVLLGKTNYIMSLIFGVATNIAMFLCLFSLMASMYTNILEQSKEVAVLRAMGLTQWQVVRVYVYEAFTLTLAASLMGMLIGAIMGWTMVAQRSLFTQMPIPFAFPWSMLGVVVFAAVGCGFIASFFPARRLNKKSIASIFRTLL